MTRAPTKHCVDYKGIAWIYETIALLIDRVDPLVKAYIIPSGSTLHQSRRHGVAATATGRRAAEPGDWVGASSPRAVSGSLWGPMGLGARLLQPKSPHSLRPSPLVREGRLEHTHTTSFNIKGSKAGILRRG